jgi:hypothetical protein
MPVYKSVIPVTAPVLIVYKSLGLENQSPSFELYLREPADLRRRTEIIPVKDSHTRIKPLALASGHGRYITVTPERMLVFVSVGEWPLHTSGLE